MGWTRDRQARGPQRGWLVHLHLLAAGTRLPAWQNQGFDEFAGRMPRECTPRLIEIPLSRRTKNGSVARYREDEGRRMLGHLHRDMQVIALDGRGKNWSTKELARQLETWLMSRRDIALLIGGPDGLAPACLEQAGQCWSLSPLTLPHGLVRVLVAEQLYRAWTILAHHPYHRG